MIRTLASLMIIASLFSVVHAQTAPARPDRTPSGSSKPVVPPVIVNINTASIQELEALPGVGAKTAERIVDYRTKKGPFKKIEELMNVQGIGEKSFLKLKPQLTVAAKPEPNTP